MKGRRERNLKKGIKAIRGAVRESAEIESGFALMTFAINAILMANPANGNGVYSRWRLVRRRSETNVNVYLCFAAMSACLYMKASSVLSA